MSETLSQAFARILDARYSARAFTPELISEDLLQRIFGEAQRAPSNCNTQPWQTAVVVGERCRALAGKMGEAMMQGRMSMDFPYDGKYEGIYRERQHGAANALYSAQDIAREDKAARNAAFMANFDFFGAPHAAFIFLPGEFGIREAADVGMYAQTLMLSLSAHGLGSCPQTALSFMADLVREELDIDPANKLLFGISFGYVDESHPANRCRTERAPLEQTTRFYD